MKSEVQNPVPMQMSILQVDGTMFFILGVLLVLAFVLKRLLFLPVLKMLNARESLTQGRIGDADALLRQAAVDDHQWDLSIRELHQEGAQYQSRSRQEALRKAEDCLLVGDLRIHQDLEGRRRQLLQEASRLEKALDDQVPELADLLIARLCSGAPSGSFGGQSQNRSGLAIIVGGLSRRLLAGADSVHASYGERDWELFAAQAPMAPEDPFPWQAFGFYVFDFVILVGLLFYLFRHPVSSYLVNRQQSIKRQLDGAGRAFDKARLKLARSRIRLGKDLERERKAHLANVHKKATLEESNIIAGAQGDVRRQEKKARTQMEEYERQLRYQLGHHLMETVLKVAAQRMPQSLESQVQEEWVAFFHEGLGAQERPDGIGT